MDMSRKSKINDRFETLLLKYYQQQSTEGLVSELSFKHMSTDKGPIVGDNKGIFTHLKTVNCDNYYNTI